MLVKSRVRTGRTQTLPWWLAGWKRSKDDRKQNTLAPLTSHKFFCSSLGFRWIS